MNWSPTLVLAAIPIAANGMTHPLQIVVLTIAVIVAKKLLFP